MAAPIGEALLRYDSKRHVVGPAPDEILVHHALDSGEIRGPRLKLRAVPHVGGEWSTIRGDGIVCVESRYLFRTDVDGLVYATFIGIYDTGDDGYADALDGSLNSHALASVAIRFYTAAAQYRWLTRPQYVGVGERDFASHTFAAQVFEGGSDVTLPQRAM